MNARISRIEFRPGFRQRTECSYWDYLVDDRRLADVFEVGGLIPPFGWLAPEVEHRFAAMLLRKQGSDFRPGRIPLFVCPECTHYDCGVFTCEVVRNGRCIEWRDFAWECGYDDELRQDDAEKWTTYSFDATAYYQLFNRFAVK